MISISAADEPIAIIGMGCRFPGGVHDWRSYWQLLEFGVDAIRQTPAQRWSRQKFYDRGAAKPGKTNSQWGGYVDDIDRFDPQLFGIAPREAASMDPQQRMLLEVAFRALEDGGQPLHQIAGQAVSVFVGISSFDYAVAGLSSQDRGVIDAYSNTGGSSSIAANRISYCFDLRGPSVAVDTACSSSLVALHMACESIWRGGAPLALAGGVNALLMPDFYVAFTQLGVLSPDGRCKSFDARADGYVRSEGAGMLLLKPLAAALRDRDPVYAVVRATALNQDGRTPGMTVPSQTAQEQLIRAACEKAGLHPSELQYIEAHGTGTPVGDPIEASAIGSVVGQGRPANQPCLIGSVKTNIGHLEAGAGIASVIKVALALQHRRIPAHLHFQQANPAIDFAALNLEIPRETTPWQSRGSRLAGINGFGYGGANAHVILEEAPAEATRVIPEVALHLRPAAAAPSPVAAPISQPPNLELASGADKRKLTAPGPFVAPVLLPLSARTPAALLAQAQQMIGWLEEQSDDLAIAEVAGYLAHRRSHHEYRATCIAPDRRQMIDELQALASSSADELSSRLSAAQLACGPAFVCSGQGPQWWAMGRGLLKYSPAFAAVIKRCDAEFLKYGDWSLLTELKRSEAESRMQKTSIAQPSIFAIQVGLAEVWQSWGIQPTALVGHSVGEIAAAYLSGGLSWEDAACVAFYRGQTMDLASSKGGMLAAGLAPAEVPRWLDGIAHEVSIAAINGPASITISGAATAIEQLSQRLEKAGIFCRRLAVEYAFHSPQMEPVREELLRALDHIRPRPTHTPMISTVTGQLITGKELGADYWWKNVRQSVRFSDAMARLADRGCGLVVELGPHPVLAYSINECFQAAGRTVHTVPSLNRQQDDLLCITKSLGSLYTSGLDIRWSGFYNVPTRRMNLPTYPFQLQRCWSESWESQYSRTATEVHPLLGTTMLAPARQWQQRIDLNLQSYLRDHVVRGVTVYPAAAMIETALNAVRNLHQSDVTPSAGYHLQRMQLHSPCVINDDQPQWVQTSFDQQRRKLKIDFRACDDLQWSSLATVDVSSQPIAAPASTAATEFTQRVQEIRQRCTDHFDAQRLYAHCRRIGLQYGGDFRGVVSGQRREGEAILDIVLPEGVADDAHRTEDYLFHPALLDSCFHGMIAADPNFDHTVDGLYLPSEIERVVFYRPPTRRVLAIVTCPYKSSQLMRCNLEIYDAAGQLCMLLQGFESRRVSGGATTETTEDLIYSYTWVEQPLPAAETSVGTPLPSSTKQVPDAPPGSNWILFMDDGGVGRQLAADLRQRGRRVVEIYRDDADISRAVEEPFYQVSVTSPTGIAGGLTAALADLDHHLDGLIYLWGLDVPLLNQPDGEAALSTESLERSTQLTTLAPVRLVQAWERLELPTASLKIVTSGAQSADGPPEATQVAQAPLIGLGRVIISEAARLRTKLIDLACPLAAADRQSLLNEVLASDGEDEVLWRGGQRWVHRFEPQAGKPIAADVASSFPCQLKIGNSAGIEELHYRTLPARNLREGEVEIEVVATGLNFSDVMKALALYPGLGDGPVELGAECSGRIHRVGPNSRWQVGDEVLAIAPGAFATQVVVNEALVARKPSKLSFQQAAALPIAFLTAHYALHECARLRSGDSILIHAASGGVGLAAMQLARLAGVRILATAGSDEKRGLLRELGASHVMDSRSLAFVQETLQATEGSGVDAVLNSLAGEAIAAGLSLLKVGGRFLEIGKRDIYDDAPLGLYPLRNNLAFFAIDLDQLFKQQPRRMGEMLAQIVERFEHGELQPLPVQEFPADDTKGAFRLMQQGKHIGKIVVSYEHRPSHIQAGTTAPLQLKADASYWLAGGLGGFGLEVARWLASRGARSLVLSGRSSVPRPAAAEAIAELERAGVRVSVLPCDISQAADVRRAVQRIQDTLPPLRGVFHTAMVLEDKLLADLDEPTLNRVLRPKVLGGWNLHRETLNLELDYFVLFSSLSSVFGHAGQANYSAANAALDSLAYYRRAHKLPATVINWGHLGEVGYLAERTQLGERLERQGVLSFTVRQATDCLEYALHHRALQLSVLRIDWSLWRGLGLTQRVSPRFAHLVQEPASADWQATGDTITAASLRGLPADRLRECVTRLVLSKTGSLLGIAADKLCGERGLLEMGLDSLMAVELRNWIEAQLEVNIAISALMRSDSLNELIQTLCNSLTEGDSNQPAPPRDRAEVTQQQAVQLLEQLPQLDDAQVSQLLSQMLRSDS